ncbi:hypothetical protein RHGRI_015311 [Rhododendron griersonianum]|uniref:CCHC-type domain-containing protein n=1 Tax=Rhododendron griersonianum TaxID=479676 RepID=A0AAV6KDB9_9ERIC|nr:hypothetical protein RHGRI_015311 [Rhododendron griersonianum]
MNKNRNHYSNLTPTQDSKNFKKFFKKNRTSHDSSFKISNNKGRINFSSGKEKREEKGAPLGLKCYECYGYGHLAHECVNKLKKKTNLKVNITWDDDSDSEKFEKEQENTNFIAFGASLQSNFSEHESSDDSEDEEGDEVESFQELREKYQMLYRESVKIIETNFKLAEKCNSSSVELVTVKEQVEKLQGLLNGVTNERDELRKEVGSLQETNKLLIESNALCEGKVEELNIELTNANNVFEQLNASSNKLDEILSIQRPTSDRSGLGFHGVSSSKQLADKLNEAKPKEVTSKFHTINTAKIFDKKPLDNKKATPKFIPTCHYCQVKGHIRPNCFKLHGYPNAKHAYATNNRWSYDNFVPRWNNGQMPRPVGYNDGHTKDMKPRHMSIGQGKSSQVKTKLIWVRRCDLHCLATHTVTKAKKINMWNLNGSYSRHMFVDNSVGVRFID